MIRTKIAGLTSWGLSRIFALIPLVALLAAAPLHAEMLALPSHKTTYSTDVRGYWFTAPVAFTITGVGVPTDASSGAQTIEIVKLPAPPPHYPTMTNDLISLFRVVGDTSFDLIPVNISVEAGDLIGVLGYRDSVNSYGLNGFESSIFGIPVQLNRFGMQYDLNTYAAHNVWQEDGGYISRVNLQYGPPAAAVPEPSTAILLSMGLAGLFALRRRVFRAA